jgi:FkbM family methyltransferase
MFRKIYFLFNKSDSLMLLIAHLYIFFKIYILKNYEYKKIIIKKNTSWLINDYETEFNILSLNKLPRYFRGLRFTQNKTIEEYGYNKLFTLSKYSNVLNVGANIGEVAMGFLNHNLNVKAVEADISQFNILLRNKKIFDTRNLDSKLSFNLYNVALSNKNKLTNFYLNPENNDSTLIKPNSREIKKYNIIKIQTKKIDDIIAEDEKIDLIVGDVEGSEPEVLKGAIKSLKKCKYVSLDCSIERNGKDTINQVINLLKLNNFEIINEPRKNIRFAVIARNKINLKNILI